jgi:multidrug efflux pump subunit AcrB
VEVQVTGDNIDSLHVATDSIWNRLARNKNINVLNTSWGAVNNRLEVIIHPEEANRLGLSKSLLSLNFALRYGGGIPVTSIWEGDHEISVVIRDANENQETIDDLKNIRVSGPIPTLTATPLTQVADVKPGWGDGFITRRNGMRTASVYGMMTRGALVGPLTKEIYKDLETLRLPEGITISKGGMADMDNQYRPQIYLGVLISLLLIFFVVLFHLKSIMLTLLVMSSLLFSLLGGALGMALSGDEFGATAILGFVTLMGIIVRCSIIMIDYAEELFRKGQVSPTEAALLSAKRRFRPVFLTSAAASMGVITMVFKDSPLWHPMGLVIFVGAFVSMLLVLTMIPTGYCLIRNKFKEHREDEFQQ